MSYEHIWAIVGLLVLAAGAALAIWGRHLHEAKRLALREMIHRERMAALEKGVALPELPADREREGSAGSDLLGKAALLGGLVLVFGGLGLLAALFMVPDNPRVGDLRGLTTLGFLPIFTGVGLLLYAWLERRAAREAGEGATR